MKKRKWIRKAALYIGLLIFIQLELWCIDRIGKDKSHGNSTTSLDNSRQDNMQEVEDEFAAYSNMTDALWSELQYFPVAGGMETSSNYTVSFSNTWGEVRTYGEEHPHEGCDIMADVKEAGIYPVVSMTDGIVENIGWLNQGGWRIGIRSRAGIYYYYAHLDSYTREYQQGDSISAGEIIGRMGDSGYGTKEGTTGMFDVHLHVGIYVKDVQGQDRAINPYWYLKGIERQQICYDY